MGFKRHPSIAAPCKYRCASRPPPSCGWSITSRSKALHAFDNVSYYASSYAIAGTARDMAPLELQGLQNNRSAEISMSLCRIRASAGFQGFACAGKLTAAVHKVYHPKGTPDRPPSLHAGWGSYDKLQTNAFKPQGAGTSCPWPEH